METRSLLYYRTTPFDLSNFLPAPLIVPIRGHFPSFPSPLLLFRYSIDPQTIFPPTLFSLRRFPPPPSRSTLSAEGRKTGDEGMEGEKAIFSYQ